MILKILPFLISGALIGGGITAAVIVNQGENNQSKQDDGSESDSQP